MWSFLVRATSDPTGPTVRTRSTLAPGPMFLRAGGRREDRQDSRAVRAGVALTG